MHMQSSPVISLKMHLPAAFDDVSSQTLISSSMKTLIFGFPIFATKFTSFRRLYGGNETIGGVADERQCFWNCPKHVNRNLYL